VTPFMDTYRIGMCQNSAILPEDDAKAVSELSAPVNRLSVVWQWQTILARVWHAQFVRHPHHSTPPCLLHPLAVQHHPWVGDWVLDLHLDQHPPPLPLPSLRRPIPIRCRC